VGGATPAGKSKGIPFFWLTALSCQVRCTALSTDRHATRGAPAAHIIIREEPQLLTLYDAPSAPPAHIT
jgi:hypothetical protein